MPINLTTPVALGNGARLIVKVRLLEDEGQFDVTVQLRTAPATDLIHAERSGTIRNGMCDRFVRAPLTAGRRATDAIDVELGRFDKPTGFTDALAAYRVSRAAFEAHLLAAGFIDATLAGS